MLARHWKNGQQNLPYVEEASKCEEKECELEEKQESITRKRKPHP